MEKTTFGVWDYLVFGLMLVTSICIGIYHAVRGKNQTTSEYLVAGGSMTFVPVALSLIATFESSIMMLGTPAESYVYGMSWMIGELGSATGGLAEILLIFWFVKRLNLRTPNEYFEERYNSRAMRLLGNVVSCISFSFYMSMVLYGQGIALQAVTGLSIYGSIIVTAGAAVLYTTIGGLKAVIWTDVLQCTVMTTGLIVVTIYGTVVAGGASQVWDRAAESGRLDISVDPDPTVRHTLWNLYFGRIFSGFGLVISPAALQRVSSIKSPKDSRRAMFLAIPGFSFLIAIALAEGIVAYAYYAEKECDPLMSEQIQTPNQIIPFMIMDVFRHLPGMSGLFLAALTSASLSTISSCLSAISIITWYDLFKPVWPNMSEFKGLLLAKATVVVFGIFGCFLAVIISLAGSRTLNQISYTFQAAFRNPLIALFYLGALCPFVNTKGAVTGFASGVVAMTWLILGSMIHPSGNSTPYYPLGSTDQCPALNLTSTDLTSTLDPSTTTMYLLTTDRPEHTRSFLELFYGLSYTLFSTLSICIVIVVGVIASLLTGGLKDRPKPELVVQLSDLMFWRLPDALKENVDNFNKELTMHIDDPLLPCHLKQEHQSGIPEDEINSDIDNGEVVLKTFSGE